MNGDWSIREEGLIQVDWLRYYTVRGQMLDLRDKTGAVLVSIDERQCRRFATIDPAGTSEERHREQRGRPASWSVIEVWDQLPGEWSRFLVLRHVWRRRVGFEGLCRGIREVHAQWRPSRLAIENEKLGSAAVDVLGRELPLETIATSGRDKVTRAAPLTVRLERGEIFLPRQENQWRADFEAELLCGTGLPHEVSDQIDAAAYAVELAERGAGGEMRMEMGVVENG